MYGPIVYAILLLLPLLAVPNLVGMLEAHSDVHNRGVTSHYEIQFSFKEAGNPLENQTLFLLTFRGARYFVAHVVDIEVGLRRVYVVAEDDVRASPSRVEAGSCFRMPAFKATGQRPRAALATWRRRPLRRDLLESEGGERGPARGPGWRGLLAAFDADAGDPLLAVLIDAAIHVRASIELVDTVAPVAASRWSQGACGRDDREPEDHEADQCDRNPCFP